MKNEKIKTFLISILCLLTLSCSFIVEDKGNIAINIPYSRAGGNPSLTYEIVLKESYGNIVYLDKTAEDTVLIKDLPEGSYTLEIYASDNQYNYTGYDVDINIKANETAKSKVTMEKTPIGQDIPKPQYKNRGTFVLGFNNYPESDNDVPLTVYILNEKKQVVRTIERKLGDMNLVVLPFGKYTLKIECEKYTYDGHDEFILDKTGETTMCPFLDPK